MSFNHKAFIFDYDNFQKELAPILHKSLSNNKTKDLIDFVTKNIAVLKHPDDDGDIDQENWKEVFDPKDPHSIGDLALTKYYDPSDDYGLAEHWRHIDEALPEKFRTALIGSAFGPEKNFFDPGQMGTYIQSPKDVKESIKNLSNINFEDNEELEDVTDNLKRFLDSLKQAAKQNKGMYIPL